MNIKIKIKSWVVTFEHQNQNQKLDFHFWTSKSKSIVGWSLLKIKIKINSWMGHFWTSKPISKSKLLKKIKSFSKSMPKSIIGDQCQDYKSYFLVWWSQAWLTGSPWSYIHTLLHNVKYAYFMHEKNGGIIYGGIFSGGISEVFFLGVFFPGIFIPRYLFWGYFFHSPVVCAVGLVAANMINSGVDGSISIVGWATFENQHQ